MAHDVFISYSTVNQKIIKALSAYLEKNGISCWVAYRNIPAGSDWADFIPQAIKECKIMVYVHSSTSNLSLEINKEIALSLKHNRPILPFKIENTDYSGSKAYHLVTINWIDAFPNPEDYFEALLIGIRNLLLELEQDGNYKEKQKLPTNKNTAVETAVKTRKNNNKIKYAGCVLGGIIAVALCIYGGIQYSSSAKVASDFETYRELVVQAEENYRRGEDYYILSLNDYQKAALYEIQYANGKYADKFNLNIKQKIVNLETTINSLVSSYKEDAATFEECEDRLDCLEELIVHYEKISTLQPENQEAKEKLENYKKMISEFNF